MNIVTTHNSPKDKPFSWSYSRLKNFETCPKRHYHIDIAKDVKEDDESEALLWGNEVHKALAKRMADGTPLPPAMKQFEGWCGRILTGQGKILVEQKLAITKDFGATQFFGRGAWFRGVGDVIKLVGNVALIVDWKTGRILEDSVQLALMAQCVFAHYPDVLRVRSEFIWLKEDANTRGDFSRDDMAGLWRSLWPRIELMKTAAEQMNYPPKPGGLCRRWCPVTQCPHHGG